MAVGQKVTYQDVQEIMEMVAPGIAFQVQDESQFLMAIGFPGRMGNTFDVQHKWMEKRLNANTATILNGGGHAAGDTTLNLIVGQGANFRVGQVWQADGSRELMIVTATAADSVDVTRGHNATVAVAIADGELLTRGAWPQLEKDPGGNPEANARQERDNFTQLFRGEICVSSSRKKVRNKGQIMDEVREQLVTLQRDKLRDLARSSLIGRRSAAAPRGSDTVSREMDGIIYQILDGALLPNGDPVIINAGGLPLDIAFLDDLVGGCWERGGRPDALLMGQVQYERLAVVIDGRRRYTSRDSVAGGRVNEYVSKHGTLKVLDSDIFVPSDIVLAIDTKKLSIMRLGAGREVFEVFEQGKQGTSDEIIFEGEFTLEAKNASDGGHGLLQGLART